MPTSNPQPVTARLTTPAQMVASLPLWLGYVPSDSLVVACCHEPRGRIGLTLRFDLPPADIEHALVEEVVARVAHQHPTRVLIAVYSDEEDDEQRARKPLVDELCDQLGLVLPGLRITEAVLVREGLFWSYLCDDIRCCPAEGTPVSAARTDSEVALLEAEQVLRGQVVQRDRDALAQSLAAPQLLAAAQGRQHCEHEQLVHRSGREQNAVRWRDRMLSAWLDWAAELDELGDRCIEAWDAAELATSLEDVLLRDTLIAECEPATLLPVLREVMRLTPAPFDAPVCTVFAWLTYSDGGGAEVTIALERALTTNPAYGLARLLRDVMLGQVPPAELRRISREGIAPRRVRRRSRRGS